MTSDPAQPKIRIVRTFDAPAEEVFLAWVSPDMMRRWWHAGPDWSTTSAEADVRVGGRFQVTMRADDGVEHVGTGVYTVIEPPHRLAWRWIGEGPARTGSLVQVDLVEHDGRTIVELRQWKLPADSAVEFRVGWGLCLDNLAIAIATEVST